MLAHELVDCHLWRCGLNIRSSLLPGQVVIFVSLVTEIQSTILQGHNIPRDVKILTVDNALSGLTGTAPISVPLLGTA
ncbi:hypothetical protein CHS0354_005980 [Potamilus streckersoni]|uniref:Uncharacterized protein n=1 Tax=Potamilus streckersoni TaxID=2493646 RepID=A0AAE0VHF1_9BIVA|nr:hypothetical protein CHS0354_005980 [Potamilus streckersoni]